MTLPPPRIAVPDGTSADPEYNQRSWRQYAEAVERAGGIPVHLKLSEPQSVLAGVASSCSGVLLPGSPADVDPEKYGAERIPECGAKDAAREAVDDLLLQDAFNLHKPILGICYGLQSLNVWRNGTLIQDLPRLFASSRAEGGAGALVDHAPDRTVEHAHAVVLVPESGLSKIIAGIVAGILPGTSVLAGASELERAPGLLRLSVNSSHHQAIDRAGDQMRIVAKSPEDGVIEAIEGQTAGHFVLGVQWHPERTCESSDASRAIFRAFVQAAGEWKLRPIQDSVAQDSIVGEPIIQDSTARKPAAP
jgi:putative glutamine amidotransferase